MNPKPLLRLLTLLACLALSAHFLLAAQRPVTAAQVLAAQAAQAAVTAAEQWLATVDAGQYPESWSDASEYFQSKVSQPGWEKELNRFRKPLGGLVFRTLQSVKHTTGPAGGPRGKYVVLQFKSAFAYKLTAVETVTPMLDKDGQWKVAGYFIK